MVCLWMRDTHIWILLYSLVYMFWRTLLLVINAFETIGLQLVQCALEQAVWVHYGSSTGTKYTIVLIIFITYWHLCTTSSHLIMLGGRSALWKFGLFLMKYSYKMVKDPPILVLSLTMFDVTQIPDFYTNLHPTEVVTAICLWFVQC